MTINADHITDLRDHKHKRYATISHDVARTVEAVVTAPVRHQKSFRIGNRNHGAIIAAWACIYSFWSNRGQHAKTRSFNPFCIKQFKMIGPFAFGTFTDHSIKRIEFIYRIKKLHQIPHLSLIYLNVSQSSSQVVP